MSKSKICNILDLKDVEKKIDESISRSKETNKEHGFNFCSENGRIIATDIEEGDKDSLGIDSKCPAKSEVVGAFHIHTRPVGKDAIPSPADITKGITDEDINFFCIGASVDNRNIIRCFAKGDLENEMKDIFVRLGLNDKDIDKSSKLISSRMTIKKGYLDKLSCQKEL